MKLLHLMTAAAVAAVSLTVVADVAEARKRHHHHHHHDWDNRRDARRAGIIAGTAAAGISRAVANDNARDHYRECMDYYGFNNRYERYCREEYYRDQYRGRRAARRAGVVVGLGVREIVRD
ncbi:hypothetical protein [Alterisphingorhabdus coralli]|uniref:Uncharacterized protein n=1 Tax=Alterisphingorhabdus coralli TaxID=3071408 RepID=A0AA97F8I4_9SPHN|nr:hypothetical protein [Parasphingorhabdus sp. SCSIO 66989]WOE76409.1 hypothetical protein RB602_06760 [Parasphingorhabdus sp. SCSIO 66989]